MKVKVFDIGVTGKHRTSHTYLICREDGAVDKPDVNPWNEDQDPRKA